MRRHAQIRRFLIGLAILTVASVVGLPTLAQADIGSTPTVTWGVGPATPTTASVGKPRVLAILPVGDRIYVGGTFDSVIDPSGRSYPVKNLAVFSASTGAADLSFTAQTNNTVTSLATDGSSLFVGGFFGSVNGQARAGLAAVDLGGGSLRTWKPSVVAGNVDSIVYAGGSVYAGGNFSSVTGSSGSGSQAYLAKVDAVNGAVDSTWAPAPDARVRALTLTGDNSGRLFVAGEFLSVSGTTVRRLAAVSLQTGALDAFRPGPNSGTSYSPVIDVTADGSRVYVAVGGGGNACAAYPLSGGNTLFSDKSNGDMQSVRLTGGLLYCGGHFGGPASFAGASRQKLAAVNPATGAVTAFNPRINSAEGIWAMGSDASHLFIGGDFSLVSGVAQPHFAMFTESGAATAPLPPSTLVAQPDNGVVHLSWAVPSNDGGSPVQRYKLYRSTTPGGQQLTKPPLATISSSALSYEETSAVNGTTYYYTLVAINAIGTSNPSNEASATPSASTVVSPPGAPTSVMATTPAGYIHLQWNPPSNNGGAPVTAYTLYRATTPGGASTQVGTSSTTSLDDTVGLVAGTTYYYTVTATNTAGEGARSKEVAAKAVVGTPGPPTLTVTTTSGTVDLRWTVPGNGGAPITKYTILRDGVRLVSLTSTGGQPPATAYTDRTAAHGVSYTYQVRGANSAGNGQLSTRVTVTAP